MERHLENCYRGLASDKSREAEALEWAQSTVRDIQNASPLNMSCSTAT